MRFNIVLDDVSITHVAFSPEFTHAVEAKQVAQQDAQRAAFVVDKARQEKQAMVVRAQGEARSAELIGDAVKKSRSYIDLREFDNAKTIAAILEKGNNKFLAVTGSWPNARARTLQWPTCRVPVWRVDAARTIVSKTIL